MFLAGHIVAMVTYCATNLTATCSPMIGQFFDTIIVASFVKGLGHAILGNFSIDQMVIELTEITK